LGLSCVYRLAVLDGLEDDDLVDLHRVDGERIVGQDHQVGELADGDRALAIVLEVAEGFASSTVTIGPPW